MDNQEGVDCMKVSIYDVAKKAGVSVVTVSRVINNATTVRATSKDKVMKAINELNYQPSAAARSLARGKTNVIGMLVPDMTDPFLMEVVQTVDIELEKKGYFLALSVIGFNDMDSSERSNFIFQQDRVDGILILTPLYEEDYVQALKNKQIPFVIMDNQIYPYTVPSIVVDNFKGGYDVTKHLIETNHEKIAHIGGPTYIQSANERCDGFVKALQEVGMTPHKMVRADFSIESGYEFMMEWLDEGQMPDAVFAADDHIAFGVIDALRERGFSVPRDVSVIGFDDHPFSDKLHPRLTTVKQPAVEIGLKGVETLMQIMRGEIKRNIIIKLEPQLIKRESVITRK
jgi:LacI family transcriptional regulator